jgi:hypothetical protein
MAKAKMSAKKPTPKAKDKKPAPAKLGLLKAATNKVAKAAATLVKSASKGAVPDKGAKPAKVPAPVAAKPAAVVAKPAAVPVKPAAATGKPAAAPPTKGLAKAAAAPAKVDKVEAKPGKAGKAAKGEVVIPGPEKARPRATKLPPVGELLTKREMEQLLTAGTGRGVAGEGSLKGRLVVKEAFPYLHVVGRDKRELVFLLQGPDQEVLPAYVEHKVSVSGLIKKTTNYGGTVDVRKYTAKKPETEVVAPAPVEDKLKYLSPGEVEQVSSAGMGAGVRGFCALRGSLEMTGEEFFLVVSNGGTRQQVSFLLEGKNTKGLRKHVGNLLIATGVLEKSSGWGGRMQMENFEPRPAEHKSMSRDAMEVVSLEGTQDTPVELRLNQGLSVRLPEKAGYTWAIEPTTAKRCGLREANFEPASQGAGMREFFFTPRNPGTFEIDFFLAKVFSPAQVAKTQKLPISVRPV